MVFVYKKVKKKLLLEKESIFWMIGALGILILGIFPNIIIVLANILHIKYAPSLLFLMGIIFSLALIFRITNHISIVSTQIKELAQYNAILEKRISELEKLGK